VPEGYSADKLRERILTKSNLSLGSGLGRLADRVFRIGHLGDFNDPMVIGTLGSIEMGLKATGIAYHPGGLEAAVNELASN
jgi:alanine-glyoxylate transaminase/serine-glyoxylate transaminase/serine-pyruvate transaminase